MRSHVISPPPLLLLCRSSPCLTIAAVHTCVCSMYLPPGGVSPTQRWLRASSPGACPSCAPSSSSSPASSCTQRFVGVLGACITALVPRVTASMKVHELGRAFQMLLAFLTCSALTEVLHCQQQMPLILLAASSSQPATLGVLLDYRAFLTQGVLLLHCALRLEAYLAGAPAVQLCHMPALLLGTNFNGTERVRCHVVIWLCLL